MWRRRIKWIVGASLLLWFAFCLPRPLFAPHYATVVYAKDGQLLGARTASDEQWRFPPSDTLPRAYQQAVLLFEDQWFRYHPGVNPVSFAKALWENTTAWKVKRGGSTITMQVIRLSRGNPRRTLWEKALELVRALRLEVTYSKAEILALYAAHAPFGGNIVGVEAAAWRYFGRPLQQLSVAEYATLALLPNAPSWIRPGKNAALLLDRRNQLLLKMHQNGYLDSIEYTLATAEPLPEKTYNLPQTAYHFVQRFHNQTPGKNHHTQVDASLQMSLEQLLQRKGQINAANQIHNAGLLIAKVQTGEVVAYVGNVPGIPNRYSPFVDMVQAPRSSGSTLKPFLYALSLDAGILSPNALLPDLPVVINGFRPRNFANSYDGAVPASEALSRSLNIPMVKLLQEYHVAPFLEDCNQLGFVSLDNTASHYGLSLILGGGEVTLWELVDAYAYLGRQAQALAPKTAAIGGQLAVLTMNQKKNISSESAWWTSVTLRTVTRPEEEQGWEYFAQPNIAWKTGTSYGFRDAWAIGYTTEYVVGVWVGNASGEGRPGIVGGQVAAPLLFQAFNLLPRPMEMTPSYTHAKKVRVCKKSGAIAGAHCESKTEAYWPEGAREQVCAYHKGVVVNKEKSHRVRHDCFTGEMETVNYFELPPSMAWYYRQRHADYTPVPPLWPACQSQEENVIQIIYPENHAEIVLPRDRDGSLQKVVVKAAHQNSDATLFWDVDGQFHSSTTIDHSLALTLQPGHHIITVTDQNGQSTQVTMRCL